MSLAAKHVVVGERAEREGVALERSSTVTAWPAPLLPIKLGLECAAEETTSFKSLYLFCEPFAIPLFQGALSMTWILGRARDPGLVDAKDPSKLAKRSGAAALAVSLSVEQTSSQGEIISACPIVGSDMISSRGRPYDSPR